MNHQPLGHHDAYGTPQNRGGSLENPGGSFQDVDGLASLLLAVRLVAAKVLSEEVGSCLGWRVLWKDSP